MARTKRDVLTVFIGSPGDLADERTEAREVVDRVNHHVARNLGVHVELRGWEDTLPGFSRPQAKINEDIQASNLFIGLLWRRWGTPTGEYSSGFEEEFEVAKELYKNGELEDIWLFFKEVPDEMLRDPGEQLQRVLSFQDTINAQREVFYDTFASTERWSKKFHDYLADYLTREKSTTEVAQTGAVFESEQVPAEEGDENDLLRSLSVITEAISQDEIGRVDRFHAARAHLASIALLYTRDRASGLMGIHENQFLYLYRKQVHLLSAEEDYVLRNLAAGNDNLTVGWFWIDKTPTELADALLALCSFDGLDKVKIRALELLRFLNVDVEFEHIRTIINRSNPMVAFGALHTYGERAPLSAVESIEDLIEHGSSEIAEMAWRTVLVVLARHDPERAITWLRRPTPHRKGFYVGDLVERMAPVWSSASNESVRVLLEDESPSIRRKAFEVVKADLSEDDIRRLTEDEDALVRATAYMELVRRGVEVDEEVLEEKLQGADSRSINSADRTRQKDSSPPSYDLEDVLLERYKTLPYEDLEQGIGWFSTHGELRYEAIADSHFERFKEILRNDISQDFQRLKEKFYTEQQALISGFPDESRDKLKDDLIGRFREHDDFRFELFRRAAYRALAKHAEPTDVQFARSLLSDLRSKYFREELVQAAFEIIKEHGDADDAELLKPILAAAYPEVKAKGAELILQLASHNRSENIEYLVEMDDPDVITGVLRYSLENHDGLFLNEAYDLLFNAKEQIRLDTLAFLASTLSRVNLESLLDEYPNTQNFYYYNVVSWLDRLLYAPSDVRDVYAAKLKNRLSSAGTHNI
jgi:hypothetical protein